MTCFVINGLREDGARTQHLEFCAMIFTSCAASGEVERHVATKCPPSSKFSTDGMVKTSELLFRGRVDQTVDCEKQDPMSCFALVQLMSGLELNFFLPQKVKMIREVVKPLRFSTCGSTTFVLGDDGSATTLRLTCLPI